VETGVRMEGDINGVMSDKQCHAIKALMDAVLSSAMHNHLE